VSAISPINTPTTPSTNRNNMIAISINAVAEVPMLDSMAPAPKTGILVAIQEREHFRSSATTKGLPILKSANAKIAGIELKCIVGVECVNGVSDGVSDIEVQSSRNSICRLNIAQAEDVNVGQEW